MRKVFGILFIVLGIICLPCCFSPSIPEMIGGFIGLILISVLPAYFLLRSSGEKKDNDDRSNQ